MHVLGILSALRCWCQLLYSNVGDSHGNWFTFDEDWQQSLDKQNRTWWKWNAKDVQEKAARENGPHLDSASFSQCANSSIKGQIGQESAATRKVMVGAVRYMNHSICQTAATVDGARSILERRQARVIQSYAGVKGDGPTMSLFRHAGVIVKRIASKKAYAEGDRAYALLTTHIGIRDVAL